MNKLQTYFAPFLFFLMASLGSTAERELFVSPDGVDSNSGTQQSPYQTLSAVRDAARNLLGENDVDHVIVQMLPGTYQLTETFELGERDSGSTYRAFTDGKVTVTSRRPVRTWKKLRASELAFPNEAAGKIWVSPVGPDARFHTLYQGERRLQRCRSKGFPIEMEPRPGAGKIGWRDALSFRFSGDYPPAKQFSHVNTRVFINGVKWVQNYLKIAQHDVERRTVIPDCPIGYYARPASAFLENSPEFLDRPGEWFVDMEQGQLYLWPVEQKEPSDVWWPALDELVRVESSKDVRFEGIIFSGADRPSIKKDDQSGQHEWLFIDKANALVRFRDSRDCVIENCVFKCGQVGLRFDRLAQGHLITNNQFTRLYGNCLVFAGYGPGTKDVSHGNRVSNNDFYNNAFEFTRFAAIVLYGSGANHITNNRVRRPPSGGYAIHVLGQRVHWFQRHGETEQREIRPIRWNEIEMAGIGKRMTEYNHARNNRITQNELDGQIYISAPGSGTRIEGNLIKSIRFDDDNAGGREAFVIKNIISGLSETEGNSNCINNLFFQPANGHPAGLREARSTPESRQTLNILFETDRRTESPLAAYARMKKDQIPRTPKETWNRNLYVSDDPKLMEKLRVNLRDQDSAVIGFRLPKVVDGAIVFDGHSLPIEPIPISNIGLPSDPARERILEALGVSKQPRRAAGS